MTTENIVKLVVAVALTLAVTLGSGVVEQEMGLEITPSVYAGPCTTAGGGGC